jgi:hypothetical protein
MENLTIVNDGQSVWAAQTDDLVSAMARLGWTADHHQGLDIIREPEVADRDSDDSDDSGIAYGLLCSEVPAEYEGSEITDEIRAQSQVLHYREDVDGGQFVASRGLADALSRKVAALA